MSKIILCRKKSPRICKSIAAQCCRYDFSQSGAYRNITRNINKTITQIDNKDNLGSRSEYWCQAQYNGGLYSTSQYKFTFKNGIVNPQNISKIVDEKKAPRCDYSTANQSR